MTHHRFNGKLQSHGFQVSVGTLTMCAVFDELFKLDFSDLDVDACVEAWPTLEEMQNRFRYNVLDLALRGRFYEKIVNPVFDKGGAWEIA